MIVIDEKEVDAGVLRRWRCDICNSNKFASRNDREQGLGVGVYQINVKEEYLQKLAKRHLKSWQHEMKELATRRFHVAS